METPNPEGRQKTWFTSPFCDQHDALCREHAAALLCRSSGRVALDPALLLPFRSATEELFNEISIDAEHALILPYRFCVFDTC
jgi:hypothetical protein